ncbi:hypothetical protein Echvi_4369 [Echinicola vietnamensis DSM 17526]|uniref:Uncharacterized protein n=1 Tax=Echinicola vietnamensis (strain DSM 17526 / LMG 23754 / KMM 6221) TaxID=926556 RepID=L0G5I8_ECHVK|nr:hypothetical protein Echvi_4369 [Echinicola vietnamensis DSM 17526]
MAKNPFLNSQGKSNHTLKQWLSIDYGIKLKRVQKSSQVFQALFSI